MKRHIFGITLCAAFCLLFGLVCTARADSDLDFKLVNRTGYAIKEVYVGPTGSAEWGDNLLPRNMKNGEFLNVSFSPKLEARKWDIKVVYQEDDTSAEWHGYKLNDISKITIYYDHDRDKTTAETE